MEGVCNFNLCLIILCLNCLVNHYIIYHLYFNFVCLVYCFIIADHCLHYTFAEAYTLSRFIQINTRLTTCWTIRIHKRGTIMYLINNICIGLNHIFARSQHRFFRTVGIDCDAISCGLELYLCMHFYCVLRPT
jgi:hypothetical protein